MALLAFLLSLQLSWSLELYTWQPHGEGVPLVIGVQEHETPKQAAERYLFALKANPGFDDLFQRSPMPELPLENFKRLDDRDLNRRILIISNRPQDFRKNDSRIASFNSPAEKLNLVTYIVPFAVDEGMRERSDELVQLLNDKFPRFFVLGGDDIDLALFGDSRDGTAEYNGARDRFEKDLLTEKLRRITQSGSRDPNRLFAICRGAQFVSRLLGYQLINHIDGHRGVEVRGDHEHLIEINHPVKVLNSSQSWLSRLVHGASEVWINSFHHMQVLWRPGGYLGLEAVSHDGVPESMISRDGKILLFQFHPERMALFQPGPMQELGEKIMREGIRTLFGRNIQTEHPTRVSKSPSEPSTCSEALVAPAIAR